MDGAGARAGKKHLSKRTIEEFPQCFSGSSSAKYMKAKRWWEKRKEILKTGDGKQRLGMRVKTGPKKNGGAAVLHMKVLSGRGRKSSVWVVELHKELLSEFERLRAAGMKMNTNILKTISLERIEEAPNNSPFNSTNVIYGMSIRDKITLRWVQRFMLNNCIVCSVLCGKHKLSDAKILLIEKEVAYHLGQLKKGFERGELEEDCIENEDETHFVLNMDNGRTLGLKEEESVKYSDFVSDGDPITMMVRFTGGKNASIQPCMLIFKNQNRSYPIRGIPDNVPGVCYRSSPKGWMDRETRIEWLSEPRALPRLPYGNTRTLFVDNCSSHSGVESRDSILQLSKTKVRTLVKNATDKVQAADSFVIQKLKDAWHRLWDQ